MTGASTLVEIFCSYAHADEMWLRKLEIHLSLLQRQGLISLWHDRRVAPGTDWAKTVDIHLETASVILLLISADFVASDYCYGIEMKRALERQEAGQARVLPILVRAADWIDAPFAHLHALPTDAKPLSSWQNEDAALADVVAGIRRVIVEDLPQLSASAPRANFPAIWNVPYPRNPFFLGRDVELAQIRQRLQAGQAMAHAHPQAISGLGGLGKTQLALEYAYRYAQDYQAVLWARAESTETLVSSYIAVAALLQLPERAAEEQDVVVQAVKKWLQTDRTWLLVLDNADELQLLPDFLPPHLGGHLLLTTRASATGRLARRLEIKTFPPDLGALFLLRRAALLAPEAPLGQASQEEQERALQISNELGGLPLALDQTGAYLEETGTSLLSYWHIYQQHRADLLQQRGGLVADHPAPVATTWSLSFQLVEERNPVAADVLRLCAFLSPDAIAEEILMADASLVGSLHAPVAMDAFRLNQAIEALRAYSLVRRDPREKLLSIHRLVQTIFQDTLSETEKRLWAGRAILAINSVFPEASPWTWSRCERLLPQALTAIQIIERYQMVGEDVGRLLHKAASYLQASARYSEAERFYQRARRVFEHLGAEHITVAAPLGGLANLYYEQGKYVEAHLLYQQALQIWERHSGPEDSTLAVLLNGLASLYRQQGRYAEVEALCQRALRIWEHHLETEDPQVAYPLHNLAILYRHQGKYAEAEPLYQRALGIWEHHLGTKHPQLAYPLTGLAMLYNEQGKYAEAETLFQRALGIREQQLGTEHPQIGYALTGLADISRYQGKYAEAEALFRRALTIREQQLAPGHPLIASSLTSLAMLCSEQGKYAEAEQHCQRAQHILEHQLDSQTLDMAESMYNFARFWEAQGNREEARIWYTRAMIVYEQTADGQHPKRTEIRKKLITLLDAIGQYEEAAHLEIDQAEE